MALYKRGSTYWTCIWVNGVRYAKSTRTGNRRLAQKIDDNYKEELLLAQTHPNRLKPDMTFGALAASFIADAGPKPYHHDRLKVLLPFFVDLPIGGITKPVAREYRKYRHEQKKSLSETTINRDIQALRRFLSWAVEEGYLAANPLSRVPLAEERRKPRVMISLEEEELLLAQAAPHLVPIVTCALDTGLRRGELLSQRWEHIDFARRLLLVTHSKTCGGEGRAVPLTNRVFNLLTAKRKHQGLVFQFKGKPIHSIKKAWAAAIRRAGIAYYRFHDCRHAFNSRLVDAGVGAEVRRSLMGHSSGKDINERYTHIELAAKREAIQKLEAWAAEQRRLLEKRKKEEQEKADERSAIASESHPECSLSEGRERQPRDAQAAR